MNGSRITKALDYTLHEHKIENLREELGLQHIVRTQEYCLNDLMSSIEQVNYAT